jgi:hypothetical protein
LASEGTIGIIRLQNKTTVQGTTKEKDKAILYSKKYEFIEHTLRTNK